MTKLDTRVDWGRRLMYSIVCPNCWHTLYPEDVLFISKHPGLLGDSALGAEEYKRFIPMRFTLTGEALDAKGFPSSDLACPRCHLQIPGPMLELPPLFISLIGSPASGKSYFLTTMIWELRRMLPDARLSFSDADPVANSAVHEYERTLFLNPQPDQPTEIRKTQTDDPRLYRTARINDAPIRFPVPLQFCLQPTQSHPRFRHGKLGRLLILYDNAGEDFLPGAEDVGTAVIQHLAKSQILLTMFDPTQEPQFRESCHSDDPQLTRGLRPDPTTAQVLLRQETILTEAARRIRRFLGISQEKRIKQPLIVIVPKFDLWSELADVDMDKEPYVFGNEHRPLQIKLADIERVSLKIREMILRFCPEYIASVEGLSERVRYIPVSSLGRSPQVVQQDEKTFYGICPKDVMPKWVTVPLMYCLARWAPGMLQVHDVSPGSGLDVGDVSREAQS